MITCYVDGRISSIVMLRTYEATVVRCLKKTEIVESFDG